MSNVSNKRDSISVNEQAGELVIVHHAPRFDVDAGSTAVLSAASRGWLKAFVTRVLDDEQPTESSETQGDDTVRLLIGGAEHDPSLNVFVSHGGKESVLLLSWDVARALVNQL